MLVFGDLVWIPFTFSIQACDPKLKFKQCGRLFLFLYSTRHAPDSKYLVKLVMLNSDQMADVKKFRV